MTDLTPQSQPSEVREAWCQALESGEYVQGTGCLAELSDEVAPHAFCCLGVLTKMAHDAGVEDPSPDRWGRGMPPSGITHWAGLASDDGSFIDYDAYEDTNTETSLADLNDGGSTFEDIARIIRSEPEGLVR